MHTLTLVLLPRETSDLWKAGAELLRRHRIDEDDLDRPWRLDYWTVGGESIADEESAKELGVADNPELARNVCFVSRLQPDFVPGAVVTPDGQWYDLTDFGWRFPDRDKPAGPAAEAQWEAKVLQLFAAHSSCVAVEFDTHS